MSFYAFWSVEPFDISLREIRGVFVTPGAEGVTRSIIEQEDKTPKGTQPLTIGV